MPQLDGVGVGPLGVVRQRLIAEERAGREGLMVLHNAEVNPQCWAGVDVGGKRKGFHVAVLQGTQVTVAPEAKTDVTQVVRFLRSFRPAVVAVDAPQTPAEPGETSRQCERDFFRRRICHLYWTPPLTVIRRNPFYEWMKQGFALYHALAAEDFEVIECFPTASWTVWHQPRGATRRAAWSRAALDQIRAAQALDGIPSGLGQDGRDAIGAALTARSYSLGPFDRFGTLVVPRLVGDDQRELVPKDHP